MKRPGRPRSSKTPAPPIDVDPYLEWALGPGRPNFFLPGRQDVWTPVLLRLTGITPAEFAEGVGLFPKTKGKSHGQVEFKASVKVPDVYKTFPLPADHGDSYCMAMVRVDYFHHLVSETHVLDGKVVEIDLGLPLDKESLGDDFPV